MVTTNETVARVDELLRYPDASLESVLVNVMNTLARGMSGPITSVDNDYKWSANTNSIYKDERFFIKTWYIDDPIAFDYRDLPLAVIVTDNPTREDQYVLLDNEVIPITIYFFVSAINRAKDYRISSRAVKEMYDRASRLIRQDPTMDHKFYNVLIDGSVLRRPGFTQSGDVNSLELKLRALRRIAW